MKPESKEELQKKLNAIEKAERKQMVKDHFPEFKKLEGKYFKTRNSYGGKWKKWWLYRKVLSVKPSGMYISNTSPMCNTIQANFELCSDGKVNIEKTTGYAHSLGSEISKKEFDSAVRKIKKHIDSLISI